MADKYVVFWLTPGQKAPEGGNTGVPLSNGGIMWFGKNFPNKPKFGKRTKKENKSKDKYEHREATQEEIDEYKSYLDAASDYVPPDSWE